MVCVAKNQNFLFRFIMKSLGKESANERLARPYLIQRFFTRKKRGEVSYLEALVLYLLVL